MLTKHIRKFMNNELIKILLVDDEPDILEFISYNLSKEGYKVFTAPNGKEAIQIATKEIPKLIILDVMMPDMDGIETCSELRKIPKLKDSFITFLTARNEDYTQIAGFDAGADDYINKPIKPKLLVSRVKAILRRMFGQEEVKTINLGGLEIDREKYLIKKEGIEITLPRKEFELLSLLITKPGKVFTREEILNNVWGGDVVVGDRTIDVHVRKVREKLGEDYIKTIKGVGYKFES
jgi:two-component system, OmpR family, alkaline phosphatase synthesis response regulator PhoP